jgi:hypothetical protein
MAAVHYYLGRPARVWISAQSPRSPARGFIPAVPAAAPGSADACPRRAAHPNSAVTAASGLLPDAVPAGGLLARRRTAIARFGTDVTAAGGIGPALAAGLDPAGYPAVPSGVPQAWERAQAYLGLYERYRELYQAQVAELHHLMAPEPERSLRLPHHRPRTRFHVARTLAP